MPALIMFRLLLTSALLLAASGCATTPGAPAEPDTEEQVTAAAAKPEPPERAFPEDSIYPLLVAEFALRRSAYDMALGNYLEQADRLRDPGVSAHATHLAQFMKREPQALEAVQLWVELEPEHPEANNTLATLLIRQGRPAAAVPHLAVIARQGLQPNFPILLGGFRDLPGTEKQMLADAVAALEEDFPDDTRLLLTRALILDELEQADAASAVLEQLFALEPGQTQALLLDAKLRLEAEHAAPFERIEGALATEPDNKALRLQFARLLTRSDIDAARRQFEILSAQSPRDGDLLLSLALLNQDHGDTLAAKAYLRQVLALEQRVDEANYYLGRIAEDEGRQDEAIAAYSRVEDPEGREFFSARGRVGRLLIQRGDISSSAEFFDLQRQAYPELREQLYALEAELLSQASLLDAGMALLNQAVAELPEATSLRYSRAMLAERRGDLTLMESDLRHILALNPDNATALNALGYTLSNRTTRYDEAYTLIARALVLAPDEPAILDSMGWVLFQLGRTEEAVSYLQRAWESMPDPEVAAHLGEALWSLGEEQKAYSVWSDGLQQDPQHEILLETLERLNISISDLRPQ
ncbi:tetratricopeptide repeat protein [Haliea sp. E1-2-M8]|uniref:tetratricopeptide repeat protein n=1 Tax=Haliea sp. E1-2-M8 TaxID=3064706 RepID=UPI002726B87F|nr:tetratricopeptide repeat protein [Haliea sp. E1-2-M8]MDO8861335.1 tetratricopeptide repeat protein [Haliea sp. E1-2-M8]